MLLLSLLWLLAPVVAADVALGSVGSIVLAALLVATSALGLATNTTRGEDR
jgi:hypothetical protein